MAKPKAISSGMEPRLANWLARRLPTGKMLSSRPCRKSATPTATISRPMAMLIPPSGHSRNSRAWKATTTRMIGIRLRRAWRKAWAKSLSCSAKFGSLNRLFDHPDGDPGAASC